MDRVEVFSKRVHSIALKVEDFEPRMLKKFNPSLDTFVRSAAFCLDNMDRVLKEDDETDNDMVGYLNDAANIVQMGMFGHQYAIGEKGGYTRLANQMVETYIRKNADYGDSFGASCDKYGPVAAHVRMGDKINRLKSLVLRKQNAQVKDETVADTFLDLACYAAMHLTYVEIKVNEEEKEDDDER